MLCPRPRFSRVRFGKSSLKRIVSLLTRLIQRPEIVAGDRIEYEYPDAEYEYEANCTAQS